MCFLLLQNWPLKKLKFHNQFSLAMQFFLVKTSVMVIVFLLLGTYRTTVP